MPGTDRQPSQPPSSSSPSTSITGLTSTVSGAVWSKRSSPVSGVRSLGAWKTTTRSGTCTWGAARPAPLASIMVSIMSATRWRISGAEGSATSWARCARMGWPMRAIFRMAMATLFPRLAPMPSLADLRVLDHAVAPEAQPLKDARGGVGLRRGVGRDRRNLVLPERPRDQPAGHGGGDPAALEARRGAVGDLDRTAARPVDESADTHPFRPVSGEIAGPGRRGAGPGLMGQSLLGGGPQEAAKVLVFQQVLEEPGFGRDHLQAGNQPAALFSGHGGQSRTLLISTRALSENAPGASLCRSSFATTTSIRR